MMARLFMYSVYDRAAGAYLRPFVAQSDGAASRSFIDVCSDASHEFGKHPDDYTLMAIGIFDERKGEIEATTPTKVLNGSEAIAESRHVSSQKLMEFDSSEEVKKANAN